MIGNKRLNFNKWNPGLTALELVVGGETFVESTKDRDVVVFIGDTQAGKSTTINALLGTQFEQDPANDYKTVRPVDGKARADMSSPEKSGMSCTVLPAAYASDRSPLTFLDTRGFFNVTVDRNGDVAAAILQDMALKHAKSVKVVFLVRANDITSKGTAGLQRVGVVLNKIVMGTDKPVFFLFNNYELNKAQDKEIKSRKIGEEDYIKETLAKAIVRVHDAVEEEKKCLKAESKEYEDTVKKLQFVDLLWHNYNEKNWGYIDIIDPLSVDHTLSALIDAPAIDVNALKIGAYSGVNSEFDRVFGGHLLSLLPFMRFKLRSLEYPVPLLDGFIEVYKKTLSEKTEALKRLEKGDTLKEFEEELEEGRKDSLKRVEKEKNDLEERIKALNAKISAIVNSSLERCKDFDVFHEVCPFYELWRNHSCRLSSSGAPVRRIEKRLVGYTRVISETAEGMIDYQAEFTSRTEGLIKVAVISTSLTVPAMLTAVIFPPNGILALAANAINFFRNFKCGDCAGSVSIFVHPKEIPENIVLMGQYNERIVLLRKELKEKTDEKASLEAMGKEELRERLTRFLDSVSGKIARLNGEVKPFLESSAEHYTRIETDVRSFANVIERLYGKESVGEQLQKTFPEFMRLYEKISNHQDGVKEWATVDDGVSAVFSQVSVCMEEQKTLAPPARLRRFLEEEPTEGSGGGASSSSSSSGDGDKADDDDDDNHWLM